MGHCILDYDVLFLIQSYTDRCTTSRTMQTCRNLYESGIAPVLRDVHLAKAERVVSFVAFVLAESSDRRPYLRSLSLQVKERSDLKDAAESLKTLFLRLRTCSNLTILKFDFAENMLRFSPGLSTAIAALTSITTLAVVGDGSRSAAMLRAMRSRLITAEVALPGRNTLMMERSEFIGLLPCSRETLQRFVVRYPKHMLRSLPGLYNAALESFGYRYAQVRTLVVRNSLMPVTRDYIHAFPALTSLTIDGATDYTLRSGPPLEQHRQMNKDQQEMHGSWPLMEYLQGSMLVLYLLALPCRVRRISVHNFDGVENALALGSVLSDTRPAHLQLSVLGGRNFTLPTYVSAFQETQATSLESLSLFVYLSCGDSELHADKLKRTVIRIVKTLQLSSFELHIDCSRLAAQECLYEHWSCPADQAKRLPPTYMFLAEETVAQMDIKSVARLIRNVSPSLQRVAVQISGHYARRDRRVEIGKWSVDSQAGSADDATEPGVPIPPAPGVLSVAHFALAELMD